MNRRSIGPHAWLNRHMTHGEAFQSNFCTFIFTQSGRISGRAFGEGLRRGSGCFRISKVAVPWLLEERGQSTRLNENVTHFSINR